MRVMDILLAGSGTTVGGCAEIPRADADLAALRVPFVHATDGRQSRRRVQWFG
jgi:hypothetical protein